MEWIIRISKIEVLDDLMPYIFHVHFKYIRECLKEIQG